MTFLCHCQQIPKHSFGAKLRALNEEKKIFMGIRIPEIWQILEIFYSEITSNKLPTYHYLFFRQ